MSTNDEPITERASAELQEKLKRRSILNGESQPTDGQEVRPRKSIISTPNTSTTTNTTGTESELKKKLKRRSILNGELAPEEGELVVPVMTEIEGQDSIFDENSAVVISDELKDKFAQRRVANGEADTINEITRDVEIFQLFRQDSSFQNSASTKLQPGPQIHVPNTATETTSSGELPQQPLSVVEVILTKKIPAKNSHVNHSNNNLDEEPAEASADLVEGTEIDKAPEANEN